MLFNTVQFAAFFVVLLAVYWSLPHRQRVRLLLIGSYFFYGCWDPRFLSLIALSTLVDYTAGLRIAGASSPGARKAWIWASVGTNLGLLGFFKYYNFFAESLRALGEGIGVSLPLGVLDVVLPVGISFYTFQTMSYTLDIYRGQLKPTRDLVEFAVFVSFFPQLVAGPIERAKALLPQFGPEKSFSGPRFFSGLELMAWGLFKKMFVADNLAPIVDQVYGNPVADQTGLQILLGTYAFAIQIYCDFSGYSDVARGTARCLGFELRLNFRFPYFATNPPDFWRRWHISLSSWLRDYLYIPLGGNRGGNWLTYRNLCLTMLLGGLWHGAAWTFVLWGAYQGAILVVHRAVSRRFFIKPGGEAEEGASFGPASVLKMFLFFHVTCVGWMIFRAESLGQIGAMIGAVLTDFSLGVAGVHYLKALFFFGWFLFGVEAFAASRERRASRSLEISDAHPGLWYRAGIVTFAALSVLLFGAFHGQEFIYFQF